MEMERKAALTVTTSNLVNAPIESVWAVLFDAISWPRWNPAVTRVKVGSRLDVGTEFHWKTEGSSIDFKVVEITAPGMIVWRGRMRGGEAVLRWRFDSEQGGTRVRTELSCDGPVARFLSWLVRPRLVRAVAGGLGSLKAESERRASRGRTVSGPSPAS